MNPSAICKLHTTKMAGSVCNYTRRLEPDICLDNVHICFGRNYIKDVSDDNDCEMAS